MARDTYMFRRTYIKNLCGLNEKKFEIKLTYGGKHINMFDPFYLYDMIGCWRGADLLDRVLEKKFKGNHGEYVLSLDELPVLIKKIQKKLVDPPKDFTLEDIENMRGDVESIIDMIRNVYLTDSNKPYDFADFITYVFHKS